MYPAEDILADPGRTERRKSFLQATPGAQEADIAGP